MDHLSLTGRYMPQRKPELSRIGACPRQQENANKKRASGLNQMRTLERSCMSCYLTLCWFPTHLSWRQIAMTCILSNSPAMAISMPMTAPKVVKLKMIFISWRANNWWTAISDNEVEYCLSDWVTQINQVKWFFNWSIFVIIWNEPVQGIEYTPQLECKSHSI